MRTDTSEGPLRTGYRVCLFEGAVQGLRGQICAGKTCRRRMVGEEGGLQSGGDKATGAEKGEVAAERVRPLAKDCEPGQDTDCGGL